ncbi:MAG: LacI family DNA-binding transcriptional regulator [Clostridiales bacterium]|nr:LacI family DNA-binding transcriptional regulator [Clostridiales bacterium]
MKIYDVANKANVSIATVSRVLHGSDKVTSKTREKVMKVIDELGYTPNVFAQGLGLKTMHSIGILVPTISDTYMSSAVAFLEQRLAGNGYNCILSNSGFELTGKKSHVELLLSKRVDALILVGSTYAGSGNSDEETDYIREAARQVPIFIINGNVQGEGIYSSVCDDLDATFEATDKLIKSGYKKVVFLTDSHSYSANKKRAGYEKALKENGITLKKGMELDVENRIHKVRDYLLSRKSLNADAFIATNDDIALGVYKYAMERGLKVPEDISIVGYNNSAMSIACEPEMTSIDNKTEKICNDTVDRMISLLENPELEIPRKITVKCDLIERGSTNF